MEVVNGVINQPAVVLDQSLPPIFSHQANGVKADISGEGRDIGGKYHDLNGEIAHIDGETAHLNGENTRMNGGSAHVNSQKPETNGHDSGMLQSDRVLRSNWMHSDEASNDFRSDFNTKPTLSMLNAIISTTLGDGDNDEDPTTNAFQEYMADLVGHEAALLVASGTMGNQVSLRTALGVPPCSILADHRGHIIHWEGGGSSCVSGALIKGVVPSNGHHLTLADVQKHAVLGETMYDAPTRIISLENTLWGTVIPVADIRAISTWARSHNPPIHMHLDGARVWEAAAAGGCTLREMGECFDSIQLCFTKGLGAPLGSIITGSAKFMHRAKWARKLLGGGMRAMGVISAPARVAVDEVFLSGRLAAAQEKARQAAALWVKLGGKLAAPTETNMMWPDMKNSGLTEQDFIRRAKKWNVVVDGPTRERLVFHYQITDDAFQRLCGLIREVLGGRELAL